MRAPRHLTMLLLGMALTLLLASPCYAADTIPVTPLILDQSPRTVNFFRNSPGALLLQNTRSSDLLLRSPDRGKSWFPVPDVSSLGTDVLGVFIHPFAPDIAYVLGTATHHLRTTDAGATWHAITTPAKPREQEPLVFHATEPAHVIFQGQSCSLFACADDVFYTTNGFDSASRLIAGAPSCRFAHATPEIQLAESKTVFCVVPRDGRRARSPLDYQLMRSQDYFQSDRTVVDFNGQVPPSAGIVGLSIVKKFFAVAVMPAEKGADLDLYVSLDTTNWAMAKFPLTSSLRENAYTILESEAYSLTIDVLTTSSSGTLYRSNSNGTYFQTSLEHTHREVAGVVDFERTDWMPFIMIANQVRDRSIVTRISWDEGGHWAPLSPPKTDKNGAAWPCAGSSTSAVHTEDCALHLHSITSRTGILGKLFAEKSSPGVLTGLGVVGARLTELATSSMFVSRDGGVTWAHVADGAQHYRQLDSGALLVLVSNEQVVTALDYSKDGGQSWAKLPLPYGMRVRAFMTDADSLSSSLLVLGTIRDTPDGKVRNKFAVVHVDFGAAFNRRCSDADIEDWNLRVDGACVMGKTTNFKRVRAGSNCLVGRDSIPDPVTKACLCEDDDFECDLNYISDGKGGCTLAEGALDPRLPKDCRGTYQGSSGWRKIPGNVCSGGVAKDVLISKECATSGQVIVTPNNFPSSIVQTVVFADNNIVVRTESGASFSSEDAGRTWKDGLTGVSAFLQHDHVPNRLFAVLHSDQLYLSVDAGKSFNKVNIPVPPNTLNIPLLDFHPEEPDWLLFIGARDCPTGAKCRTEAHASKDNGATWTLIDSYTEKCLFSRDTEFKAVPKDMVYCASYEHKQGTMLRPGWAESNPLNLASFASFSSNSRTVLIKNMINYFVDHGHLLAAEMDASSVQVKVSSDGSTFAPIQFPEGMLLDKRAFTVLSSSPSRVFLDVVSSALPGRELGALFASTSDGLRYGLSLNNTNRGGPVGSVVDYSRPRGTRAVGIANVVLNPDPVRAGHTARKLVQSRITFNDGGSWRRIASTECDDACFVQLHNAASGGDTGTPIASAASAGGIAIALGNSGNDETYLGPIEEAATFVSTTGGQTWARAADKPHKGAILDRGGILVLVPLTGSVSEIQWSWDFGRTWARLRLATTLATVDDVVFHPDGTEAVVYIYGRAQDVSGSAILAVDFSQFARPCAASDVETWTLSGANGDMCLLGEKVRHPRRKADVKCLMGKLEVHDQLSECECDTIDFECDIGFTRNQVGFCVLDGPDKDKPANCADGTEYQSHSGYRKITASKCKGGLSLEDKVTRVCGRENEPGMGTIYHKQFVLESPVVSHVYTQANTVVLLDQAGHLHFSPDEGKSWSVLHSSVLGIIGHPVEPTVYALQSTELLRSSDGGKSFSATKLPAQIVMNVMPLAVHPEEPQWLLMTGSACLGSATCNISTFWTRDGGVNWHLAYTGVRSCRWARTKSFTLVSRSGIICATGSTIIYSEDFFMNDKTVVIDKATDMTIEGQYFVGVAIANGKAALRVSRDLDTVSDTHFPANVDAATEGFTTLPSHDGSLLVNLGLSAGSGQEIGRLFKSNFEGTHFSLVSESTNQNDRGFVDIEVLQGMPGISVLNTVANAGEVMSRGAKKQVRTVMTYDDGATWSALPAPRVDARGQPYPCAQPGGGDAAKCSLQLHSYTERRDPQNVFDTVSAPGLFVAAGNVGDALTAYTDANVYLTRDAGRNWNEIIKGAHQYEFGDHGAILVFFNDEEPVSEIKFTVDDGHTMRTQHIVAAPDAPDATGSEVRFTEITTRPDGTGQRFIMFGKRQVDQKPVLHFLDFSTLQQRQCVLDEKDSGKSDFEPWTLEGDKCFYGKRTVYYRRKQGHDCAIRSKLELVKHTDLFCACTRQDYECDFGYSLGKDGTCQPDTQIACSASSPRTVPSGYRKHPLTQCVGGVDLLKPVDSPCLSGGGISGGAWAAIFLVPMALGGGLYAARQYHQTGRIRLPDVTTEWRRADYQMPGFVHGAVDWVSDMMDRVRYRVRYSRLGGNRSQFQGQSSTSLLDEN
ncbi:hypothetical protein BC828DRAFT_416736 [Blastocladiella britannica]|nr:hypothetical protein BC828DRAFT_416736 [Blastocladiella britannica]